MPVSTRSSSSTVGRFADAGAALNWKRVAQDTVLHAIVFCGIIASAFIAMNLISLPPTHVTVVWLPAGIGVLALRSRLGFACLPTLLLAHWAVIALANDYSFLSFRPWSLLMAAANTTGPAIGVLIWRRWVKGDPFTDPFAFLRFVAGVAFLPALLTAWVIPAVIVNAGYLANATMLDIAERILSITLSSTLGVFLVVPIALAERTFDRTRQAIALSIAHALNLLTVLAIALIGYHLTPVGLYLCIPYALAATVICGSRGLGIGLFVFICYGLLATARGFGPFVNAFDDAMRSLIEMAAAALCLGVPAHFAGLTLRRLQTHRRDLEKVVADRTKDLRQSEESYRVATDIVSVGVFRWEAGQLSPVVNDALRQKVRHLVRPGPLYWPRFLRHLHREDQRFARDTLRSILRGETEVFCIDGRLRMISGEWEWFQARGQVIERDPRGRPLRIVGTFCDIDRDKKRLLELAAARDQADARTKARDTFLADVSHEIRTPMHAMLGFARILEGTSLDAKQAECVEAITSSGDLLLELLNDLLDFSRIETGNIVLDPQDVAPGALVRQTVKLFEETAKQKNIRLTTQIAPRLPARLRLDPTRVRQVVSNLVSNAVKFTNHGSVEVRVSASCVNTSSDACQPGKACWRLQIEVLDTGIGIDPLHLNRLFNPFTQANETIRHRFGGTGIGLALSRRLCELMGGTITVTSKPTSGSLFTATVMVAEPTSALAVAPTAPPADTTSNSALKILVVDDDRLNRRLAEMMLQRLGHEAHFAVNGRQAIEAVQRDHYDLVLMDLKMPELGGIEATQRIRQLESAQASSHLPIIALTANAAQDERTRCREAGMDDYLTKPLDLATIRETLRRIRPRFSSSASR